MQKLTNVNNLLLLKGNAVNDAESFFQALDKEVIVLDREGLLLAGDIHTKNDLYIQWELNLENDQEDFEAGFEDEEEYENSEQKKETGDQVENFDYSLGLFLWMPKEEKEPQAGIYGTVDCSSYNKGWKELKRLAGEFKGQIHLHDDNTFWGEETIEIERMRLMDVDIQKVAQKIVTLAKQLTAQKKD